MPHPKIPIGDDYYLKVFDETDELVDVFNLVWQSGIEGPYKTVDGDALIQMIEQFRDNPNSTIILLLYRGTIVGYLAASISVHPFFIKQKTAVEAGWFVQQEHRGKRSLKLLDAFERWAHLMGCEQTAVGHYEHNAEAKKVSTIYKRRKYNPIETIYVKELS